MTDGLSTFGMSRHFTGMHQLGRYRCVKRTFDGRVVVIEYDVQGTVLATGVQYNNRFCSVIEIENRKIAHWRDYMDSLAAWNALTTRPR